MRPLISAIALLSVAACGQADPENQGARYHDADRAYGTVELLASDEFAGRETNTPAAEKTRVLIAELFEEYGLEPLGNDGYFDDFTWIPRNFSEDDQEPLPARNVVGMIRGSSDNGNGPVIVMTAHYDHVGTDEDGQIYNGADDNASGTAAILEAAAWFVENPPVHTILFVGFDAEEFGLQGARSFVDEPPLAFERIAFNLNLDMVSRADNGKLWAVGTYHFPYLKPYVETVQTEAPIDLRMGFDEPTDDPRNDWTYLSDQGAFIAKGIPAIYLGVEDHPDYHQPSDTADKIDPETYANIVDTVIMLAKEIDENLGDVVTAREAAEAESEAAGDE
ncbi:MAG: M20/M25/M40 family metallo-hydrolase [Pseudomonadota bacterium]